MDGKCLYEYNYDGYTQNFSRSLYGNILHIYLFFIHCSVTEFIVKRAIQKDGVEEYLFLFKNFKIIIHNAIVLK